MLLRSRVALITAAIVAFAIASISTVTYVTTQHNLRAQLDETLLSGWPPPGAQDPALPKPDWTDLCRAVNRGRPLQRFLEGVQLLKADGTTCSPAGVDSVVLEPSDRTTRTVTLRDGHTQSGTPVRVLLGPAGDGNVVAISRSLAEVESTLTGLRNVLVVVSVLGAALAAAAGLLLTRRTLEPMARLTGAAEEIARTQDLELPVAVSGRDEVGRMGRAFAAMTGALAESRRRQRALVADAAHELRTPLTSLRTNIELLARSEHTGRPLAAGQRARTLDRLQVQAEELGDLVTELVVLARDEHGLEYADVAMATVVRQAVRRASSRARDHTFDVENAEWSVRGDAAALERMVLNLLDNAIKFSPAGSAVTVRSTPGRISVADDGPGVAPEDRGPAFDRFWRAPMARALPGSGLGLAIVADTAAAHGGRARFEDPPCGEGTLVVVELAV
ncbi:two-component system sensor histidine kinase MprB [Amycolatopsis lexingtonensis]|uniref:histidine kinase n=1 Tax=Amycolatopsis lexingtonensis TaxID=218822 RepID=A0ABR9HZT9_9PSEU|nr:HAMP domain-containing sensor histidine kinase [Amycolatopsis lexingtonensis]MBE1496207.1 two-component system sensor histidine kinase MprB [Amycolatopsis lexingtonensis]